MIPYILVTAIILAGCLSFFKLLLEKETFYKLNRIILLSCLLTAFLLPLLPVPAQWSFREAAVLVPEKSDVEYVLPAAVSPSADNGQKPTPLSAAAAPSQINTSPLEWITWLYWFGVLAFGINFLVQLALLLYRGYTLPFIQDGRYRIVEMTGDKAPCSFGRVIFINPEKYDWDTYNQILLHEKIHILQGHSFDIILAELAPVFQWFNPFAWWYRKAVENNLEYLTDDALLQQNREVEKADYQLNLLKVAAPHFPLSLTTNYNQSLLKKRVMMMNAKRSNVNTIWKYFFLLPVLVLFAGLFNEPMAKERKGAAREKKPGQLSAVNGMAFSRIDTEGNWFAAIKGDQISFQFKSDDADDPSLNGSTFPLSLFPSLPREKNGLFSLTREAGAMQFTGKFEGDQGMGRYTFAGDKTFSDFMKKEGMAIKDNEELMAFFFVDVKKAFVRMLKNVGYTTVRKNDLIPLAALHVDASYIQSIKAAGFPDIGLHDLIPFKSLGVDASYIQEIRKAGYTSPTHSQVIAFKAQGLDGKYLAAIREASKETGDEVLPEKGGKEKIKIKNKEKNNGRIPDSEEPMGENAAAYLQSLQAVGYTDLSINDITAMRGLGVTAEYIKSFQVLGYTVIPARRVITLKAQHITPELVQEYLKLGFRELPLNKIIAAKVTGTSPAFVAAMMEKGYRHENLQRYVDLKAGIH